MFSVVNMSAGWLPHQQYHSNFIFFFLKKATTDKQKFETFCLGVMHMPTGEKDAVD